MKQGVVAFGAGAIFAAGLCLAGMTRPSKVTAFLDVTAGAQDKSGGWDPSLAFVMVGAIAVTAVAFRLSGRRSTSVTEARLHPTPPRRTLDWRLFAGAAIFGVGWGLSGLCPGPAVVSLASAQRGAFVFVAAMLLGMIAHRAAARLASRPVENAAEPSAEDRPHRATPSSVS
jgi:uncharacterized protein